MWAILYVYNARILDLHIYKAPKSERSQQVNPFSAGYLNPSHAGDPYLPHLTFL